MKKVKIRVATINKKHFIIFLLCLCVIVATCFIPKAVASSSPKHKYTVVIDAGHGGIDGGSVGVVTKNDENHLNLEYAKCLKSYFENFDMGVVMTRTTLDGLYSLTAKNKKKSDMQARKKIIEESGADLVVSIHMNSFAGKRSRGAQVFYNKDSESGKKLAQCIQNRFIKDIENARKTASFGDYFLVNCSSLPSVIVECGYLSNPEEDQLLATPTYREKICYSIFCGVLTFLGSQNI